MFTDLFIYFAIVILILRGALRGLWLSLLDPIAVILATGIAYYFLTKEHNIPVALAIGLLGPIIFYQILKRFFNTGNPPSIVSRAIGAFITVTWGLIFLLPIIYLTTFLPPIHPILRTLNKDIKDSTIMAGVSPKLDAHFFSKKKTSTTSTNADSTSSPQKEFTTISATNPHNIPSLEEFLSDPRIIEVTTDPKIKTDIEQKNYPALMANPKIMKLMQDPEFIKRMMEELKKKQEAGEIPSK